MNDVEFMKIAIKEAKKAFEDGEAKGVGSLIVKDGEIIGMGHNTAKKNEDPTAHAEINAIREATLKLKSRRLDGCTLYTTCEPCPMCFSAAWWARISKLVYGASLVDVIKLGNRQINVSSQFLNKNASYQMQITGGVLEEECLELFKE